uniref:Putative plant transposon protein domain-containing protein n=1 Tax=Solanum tuberosum TaxID=4113 RepID=M1DRP2_SOLTU
MTLPNDIFLKERRHDVIPQGKFEYTIVCHFTVLCTNEFCVSQVQINVTPDDHPPRATRSRTTRAILQDTPPQYEEGGSRSGIGEASGSKVDVASGSQSDDGSGEVATGVRGEAEATDEDIEITTDNTMVMYVNIHEPDAVARQHLIDGYRSMWTVNRSDEFFHKGIVNKTGSFKSRPIMPETRVVVADIKAFLDIYHTFQFHQFNWMDNAPGKYSSHLTREFYSSYAATLMNFVAETETTKHYPDDQDTPNYAVPPLRPNELLGLPNNTRDNPTNRILASKMVSRRIPKEVGMSNLTRRLAQFKVKSNPIKLDRPTTQFGVLPTSEKSEGAERTRRLTENMVRTNLTEPLQKKVKGISINEGGSNHPKMRVDDLQPGDKGKRKKHIAKKEAAIDPDFSEPEDEQPLINRRDALWARSQSTTTSTPSAATPPTTETVPAQAPSVTPTLPIAPPPRLLNRLKDVLDTLRYHEFEQFTQPRCPYLPSRVREFYITYEELVPKNKKKASEFRPVKSVMVRGKEVECHSEHVIVVLGRTLHSTLPYEGLPIVPSLDDLNGWLAPLIFNTTPRWIDVEAPIEKWDMDITSRFWFGFISNTIMPSQN